MQYTQTTHHVQSTPFGTAYAVVVHTFTGSRKGPTIYMQANLHGPEVSGATLLTLLIQKLKHTADMSGTVIVVPIANPMSLTAVAHNAHQGRWNPIDGTNWNRIFSTPAEWKNHEEERQFFQAQLTKKNVSVHERLAAVLRLQSTGAAYVIDVHATGTANCPHVFCRDDLSPYFEPLGAPIHLLSDKEVRGETFEESHVYPFRNTLSHAEIPKACTWEISAYGALDMPTLEERLQQLQHWLASVQEGVRHKTPAPRTLRHFMHLTSPIAGYYAWTRQPGDEVRKGEVYATVFSPHTSDVHAVRADFDFVLIATYGIGAIADGEQLAWIGTRDELPSKASNEYDDGVPGS